MTTEEILSSFQIDPTALLGEGGEAQVYALDEARIVRLFRLGATAEGVAARTTLLAEIAAGVQHLPFETPVVLEQGVVFGRIYTIEKRIQGTSLLNALTHSHGNTRRSLIEQYMETAWQLGRIDLKRTFFGEIGRDDAIQTATLQAYLIKRAKHSLATSPWSQIDAVALAKPLGEPTEAPAFVHLDYFAGNVMVDDDRLNAVIDFGYASAIGDNRMNTLVATAHLVTPSITPTVTADDQAIAFAWLRERELFNYYQRGLPWLAAYWAFAYDDPALYHWCRSTLTTDTSSMC